MINLSTPVNTPIATLYFDSYRTYCMLFEPLEGALTLTYLNATSQPTADFLLSGENSKENLKENAFNVASNQEIHAILEPIRGKARSLAVAIAMESLLAHQIPYSNTLTTDDLRRIVRLEASAHLPAFDPSQFLATIYPLYGFAASPFSAMSVLVSKNLTSIGEEAAKFIGADIQRFVSAQTAAHTAFTFSYPEIRGLTALCGLQHGYLDVSVIRNNALLHAATVSLKSADEFSDKFSDEFSGESSNEVFGKIFGETCKQALNEASEAISAPIESAYFFGSDLTKTALEEAALTLNTPVHRMNPLRQLRTTIDEPLQRYASQVAHTLVPCIGAALPEIQPGIILSTNLPQQRLQPRKTA